MGAYVFGPYGIHAGGRRPDRSRFPAAARPDAERVWLAQNVGTISSGQETWNGAGERNREGDSSGGSGTCHLGLRLAPYSLGRTRHRDFDQSSSNLGHRTGPKETKSEEARG